MRKVLNWFLLFIAMGCASDPKDPEVSASEPSNDDTTDDEDTTPVTPQAGVWEMENLRTAQENCGLENISQFIDDSEDGQTLVTLDLEEDNQFTLTVEDGAPIACTLENNSYQCTPSNQEENLQTSDLQLDAMLDIRSTWRGRFSSSQQATANADLQVNCTGSGCAALQLLGIQFPCSVDLQADIFALDDSN